MGEKFIRIPRHVVQAWAEARAKVAPITITTGSGGYRETGRFQVANSDLVESLHRALKGAEESEEK